MYGSDESRDVMKPERQLLRWPVSSAGRRLLWPLAFALTLGAIAFSAAMLGAFGRDAALGAVGGVVASALLLALRRSVAPAGRQEPSPHRRAVERLSAELTSLETPADVASAIERTIARLVPSDAIEVSFGRARAPSVAPSGGNESGEHEIVVPTYGDGSTLVVCPLEVHGAKLGRIRASRPSGPSFSAADVELLRAIAHEGALVLAHATAYSELESRRKQQAAAFRDEREALVETLSAEIAHEVRYPINFFRTIFQRASGYRALEEEDIEIGCEEVDRLERLVSGLRRMATQHLERRPVDVAELCARAEVLLRDRMQGQSLVLQIEHAGVINCDVDKVTQVLVNLLANALDAIDGTGSVGIEWRSTGLGGELSVWDTGPGFTGDPSKLFAPWYTTKPRGTGLGLAITHRLVRAHGWSIEAIRRDGRTIFTVTIPVNDVSIDDQSAAKAHPRGTKGEVA